MTTIEITEAAQKNIDNMFRRVEDIKNKYGPSFVSNEAQEAEESLLRVLRTIFQWPGTVYAEDDLSLTVQSNITIGIIFHRKRNKKEDGSWEYDPLLGTWSSHS